MKALRLLSVLPHNPREFVGRLVTIGEGGLELLRNPPVYEVTSSEEAFAALTASLGSNILALLEEPQLRGIQARVDALRQRMPENAPFGSVHNADALVAGLCYALARALQPKVVVETGVCYGVTSAHLLQALMANGSGHLHSIDLPPLGKNGNDFVGWFVPTELRSRWTLHRGTSRRLLRPLLAAVGRVDLYIHDSLHTYRNMTHEFHLVWSALRPGGVLVSDDIEGNAAFAELMTAPDVLCSFVMKQGSKDSLVGVAIKGDER